MIVIIIIVKFLHVISNGIVQQSISIRRTKLKRRNIVLPSE